MTEWHLPPEVIYEGWTQERLALLFSKRNERIRAMNQADKPEEKEPTRISDTDFFAAHGVTVGRV